MTVPLPPTGLLKGEEPGECLRVCLLINLSKDAEGRPATRMHSTLPSPVHVWQRLERLRYPPPPKLSVGFGLETHRTRCVFAPRVPCCWGWLTEHIAPRTFWGELSFHTSSRGTQLFWRRTFSPGKEQQEVDEHRGTCSPPSHWFVFPQFSEYWPIQAAIFTYSCDL